MRNICMFEGRFPSQASQFVFGLRDLTSRHIVVAVAKRFWKVIRVYITSILKTSAIVANTINFLPRHYSALDEYLSNGCYIEYRTNKARK